MPKFIQLKAISGFYDIGTNQRKTQEENREFSNEIAKIKNMFIDCKKHKECDFGGHERERKSYCTLNEDNKQNVKNVISEFWDTVQSKITLMESLGIPLGEVLDGYKIHIEKLEDRGYKFK